MPVNQRQLLVAAKKELKFLQELLPVEEFGEEKK